jgi:hypothetical protein
VFYILRARERRQGEKTVSEQSAFDAAKYITKVSGRDYLEVKWRLVWLRTEHPEAQIETELMEHQKNAAVFRARVVLPSGASATGWGSEAADDFGDYLEKAETKALGRALAALGFGTQFCQDYDFGAERQRVVDSPIDIRGGQSRPSGLPRQEATPKQITYLHAIAREAGLTEEDLEERARESFGAQLADLGRRDVSTLIEQIQAERTVA